ncbi:MAG: archaeal proteasome endopeptidase complex subunit beta [Candidatus Aenigmarchaeota archaeon]|nr:archaeal proteasome endopeptidase complex subunit beta [Candidatus Aenigmarchaeota archaeon]
MMEKEIKSGTTTVGIVCKDGVVLAAERKSTMGYLVASKEETKITQLAPHIAMTEAGMVGDLQALARYMRSEIKLFELQNKKRMPVSAAATLLANILYSGRWSFFPYYVQIMLAGYDDKGASLFVLHPDGSKLEEKKFFSTGSGSPIAFGVLEDGYREDMKVDEGVELAVRAIRAAVERDIASGGKGIDVVVITKDGIKKVAEEKVEAVLKTFRKK